MFQHNDLTQLAQPHIPTNSLNKAFFDINRVPGNGTLIFPLSMSRLFLGQDPKMLYDFLCFFDKKIVEKTVDIVFVYTNGLYFNNVTDSSELRQKTNAQMITHKRELSNLIKKGCLFSPSAVHFYLGTVYYYKQMTIWMSMQHFLNYQIPMPALKNCFRWKEKTNPITIL